MCGTNLVKQFLRVLCYPWFAPVKSNLFLVIPCIMCNNLVKILKLVWDIFCTSPRKESRVDFGRGFNSSASSSNVQVPFLSVFQIRRCP